MVAVLLLVVLHWKKPEAGGSAATTSLSIKLCVVSLDRGAAAVFPHPSHRGDGDDEEQHGQGLEAVQEGTSRSNGDGVAN